MANTFVPVTPGGTVLMHLERDTEEQAWEDLMREAAHMPYRGKDGFIQRGYTVEEIIDQPVDAVPEDYN